ncbi:purine-cytosine permease family protein [Burkholderia glumae]|uniref:Cytosine permease n=1 Tax=Burkholderia glumae TaxID=337 RepID=A0AAQ0BQ55_BURGL|nr:cytosine permease [Burkholderia glumae]ACR31858.1 cytosine/purines, uracil, thiamine, allantoin permease [Burkholderia glumae BGR1]AJY64081.1 permease for cytosine/purine, uracil, thiamine, allantoin family protein [Burkholderia glumae LMG 2196 = ATCC 33617]KHJ61004.1 allantoin permease [Burkholderia glumae]MCM2484962.1 cytosine permease [Burkholderia glumae]MCM2495315.1 cytosine permease [Burkholderia glumae]
MEHPGTADLSGAAAPAQARFSTIETRSIDYVPDSERHGRVIDQGPFWFLGNFQFFTIAIGFVGPGMGLSLGYTILSGVLGILFGTLFMAFHASQGAHLGLPQMIQSRAQFGYRGVVVVLLATAFTFVAFNVVDVVLMASGLHAIFGWSPTAITLATALLALLLAVYGHDWLHRAFKWMLYASLPLYVVLSAAILTGGVAPKVGHAGGFSLVAFASQFAASASYNITYAPYVSDYSRYLPRHTRPRAIIGAVFAGAASSAIWLIALGAWLASRLGASDGLIALNAAGNMLFHGFGALISIVSIGAMVATMGLNNYSAMLTLITGLDSFRAVRPTRAIRVVTLVLVSAAWVAISMLLTGNAIDILFAALTMMLYLLAPWTAVNLVDYFFVRRGRYAITHLFSADGIYGAWGLRGLASYAIGLLASVPFFVLPGVYTGALAARLGGVDVAWAVGLAVATLAYLLPWRGVTARDEAAAIGESDDALGLR